MSEPFKIGDAPGFSYLPQTLFYSNMRDHVVRLFPEWIMWYRRAWRKVLEVGEPDSLKRRLIWFSGMTEPRLICPGQLWVHTLAGGKEEELIKAGRYYFQPNGLDARTLVLLGKSDYKFRTRYIYPFHLIASRQFSIGYDFYRPRGSGFDFSDKRGELKQ